MLLDIKNKCTHGFDMDSLKTYRNDSITEGDRDMLRNLFKNIFKMNPGDRYELSQIKKILSNSLGLRKSQKETI